MSMTMRRRGSMELLRVAAALFVTVAVLPIALPAIAQAGSCGGSGNPPCSGTFLNGYFDAAEPASKNGTGAGDNILAARGVSR